MKESNSQRKKWGECEAPEHVWGCNGLGETKDHFTPRCIARVWKWKPKQINAPENIQRLSKACHASKDASTPIRLHQLKEQRKGKMIKFGEHAT